MTEVECEQCGTAFDTEREPSVAGASTERCPYCGTEADLDDADATATATVDAAGSMSIYITIEIDAAGDP